MSPVRGQKLKEVLQLHEFRRESSELEDWMNQQRQTAESQDLGNDYQHVQVTFHCTMIVNINSSVFLEAEGSCRVVCVCGLCMQLVRGKFEGFLKKLEVGEERLQNCRNLAVQLIHNKHPQSSAIKDTLQQLR